MKLGVMKLTHECQQVVLIDHREVKRILAEAAIEAALAEGFPAGMTTTEVELYEATEGSPAYKVGYAARVTLTKNLEKPDAR